MEEEGAVGELEEEEEGAVDIGACLTQRRSCSWTRRCSGKAYD